jgi:amino acid adenylation domain-containing protein
MAYLLSQLLTESVVCFPEQPAVSCGNDTLSYSQLDTLSGKMAAVLCECGVRNGDRIGIYMTKSVESVVAIFAILKAGAVYVPMDWFAPMERLEFIVGNCAMKAVVTSTAGAHRIASERNPHEPFIPLCIVVTPGAEKTVVPSVAGKTVFREAIDKQEPIAPVTHGIIDSDLAYILYTSGSTGAPKGVMLSHLNALTFVTMANAFFSISSNDRLINHAPLHFDLSVFDLFCAIKAGGCAVLLTEKEVAFPVAVVKAIQRREVTIWNSVPSALIRLVVHTSLEETALSSLRLVLFAGETFPSKFLRPLMGKLPHAAFYNMYGQTEANSSTWYRVHEAPGPDDPPLPIGKAFPNYDVFALDDSGALVTQPGSRGELYVRGAAVGLGYWNNAEKTASSFVTNPLLPDSSEVVYRTGDIVTIDDAGNYVYTGRKDLMVKCRGFRVDIGEIESTMHKVLGVAEAAVAALPDDMIGNRLVGFFVPAPGENVSPEELKAFCEQKIPRYMMPEAFLVCESFPRTSTGKVDRGALLKKHMVASSTFSHGGDNG